MSVSVRFDLSLRGGAITQEHSHFGTHANRGSQFVLGICVLILSLIAQ